MTTSSLSLCYLFSMLNSTTIRTILSQYIPRNTPFIIAVSGGPDSMCLLDLCQKIVPRKRLVVAHFNHQIRKDALQDKQLVENYCRHHHLVLEYGEKNIPPLSRRLKKTLEETARIERYAFLRDMKEKHNASYILTAHHADDNVETILLHFIRGAGIHGLIGLQEIQQDIIRPLLSYTKNEIHSYCQNRKIPYRMDTTNTKLDSSRNQIRLLLLPLVKRINPHIEKTLLRNVAFYKDLEIYLEHQSSLFLQDSNTEGISQNRFVHLPVALQRSVLQMLYTSHYRSTENLSFSSLEDIRSFFCKSSTGKKKKWGRTLMLENNYGMIKCHHKKFLRQNQGKTLLRIPGKTYFHDWLIESSFATTFRKNTLCIAYDSLRSRNIYVRTWGQGDRFNPLGMQGTKKLQDLFTDWKIPQHLRHRLPLIVDNTNRILAVYNLRIDDRVKVTKKTKKILMLSITP